MLQASLSQIADVLPELRGDLTSVSRPGQKGLCLGREILSRLVGDRCARITERVHEVLLPVQQNESSRRRGKERLVA
jgi:hypothetical protein